MFPVVLDLWIRGSFGLWIHGGIGLLSVDPSYLRPFESGPVDPWCSGAANTGGFGLRIRVF
jgi:hypothetical protein